MKLKDTVYLMNSSNHVDRMRAEYYQLNIRIERLEAMLKKNPGGEMKHKPHCRRRLLKKQLRVMRKYARILKRRAELEYLKL